MRLDLDPSRANEKVVKYQANDYVDETASEDDKEVIVNGVAWTLQYSGSKVLHRRERVILAIHTLAKTVMHLGKWLFSGEIKENWRAKLEDNLSAAWNAKKIRQVYCEIIGPPIQPVSVELSDDQREQFEKCLQHLKDLAPNDDKPLTFIQYDVKYCAWWDSEAKSVNVQKSENFYGVIPAFMQLEKLGFKESDGNYECFVNESKMVGFTEEQVNFIAILSADVVERYHLKKAFEDLEEKFNAHELQLLFQFLKGNLGSRYRFNTSDGLIKSARTLDFGRSGEDTVRVWMRVEEIANDKDTDDDETDGEKDVNHNYYINLQLDCTYNAYGCDFAKLSICLNAAGEIKEVGVDGEVGDAKAVKEAIATWSDRFAKGMHSFLMTHAFQKSDTYDLVVHPVMVSKFPELVLKHLCRDKGWPVGTKFRISKGVKFLMDTLEVGSGIDAGGLRKQLVIDLCRHLMDGSPSRTIKMSGSGIPKLSGPQAKEEIDLLICFGQLLAVCIENGGFSIGRLFPDNYFGLLSGLFGVSRSFTRREFIISTEEFVAGDEDRTLWDLYKNPRKLTREQKKLLTTSSLCEEEEIPEYPWRWRDLPIIKEFVSNDYKEWVKGLIEDYLLDPANGYPLQGIMLAAQAISMGMQSCNDPDRIRLSKDVDLSMSIQGEPFSRTGIADRIFCDTNDPVVHQKAQWLKEHICDPTTPEEWVKRLLETITGMPVALASTRIKFNAFVGGRDCIAHTCSCSIDIPTSHINFYTPPEFPIQTNKQFFIHSLEVTMSETRFNMG